ncbi:MAG: hypothetical protein M1817_004808 [Caeruleum heppii]|nr:MAG: hypothetical protein M1817_004808 [Caeruleum heppii]
MSSSTSDLRLAKVRSAPKSGETPKLRFPFELGSAPDHDTLRSPIVTEHEHGLGTSGLRRIRQHPPSRTPTMPSSESSSFSSHAPPRSSSMTLLLTANRAPSNVSSGPASPILNFGEDLNRFPSESLHSFSFAHQAEDSIQNRQNILKRSIDFMRDRLGWAASNPAIANAQAKISGDKEIQGMMELLSQTNALQKADGLSFGLGLSNGPLTGPANLESKNVFEEGFFPRSESPDGLQSSIERPKQKPREEVLAEQMSSGRPLESREAMSSRVPVSNADGTSTAPMPGEVDVHDDIAAPIIPTKRRTTLKRTYTDISLLDLQSQLMEALAKPYLAGEHAPNGRIPSAHASMPEFALSLLPAPNAAVHGHASRWAPAAQAIFTTEAAAPWTILAANDLACLVFGVTKAEVRKMSILEVVREERRTWLEEKLRAPGSEADNRIKPPRSQSQRSSPVASTTSRMGTGVTAQLLSKPSWRERRSQTDDGSGSTLNKKKNAKVGLNHPSTRSRGVLLCGDVVPIRKRNGATGSASLWVKEKRGGLIWVLEEIREDVSYLYLDERGQLVKSTGATSVIWGEGSLQTDMDVGQLLPSLPRRGRPHGGPVNELLVNQQRYFTASTHGAANIPVGIEYIPDTQALRVSSFPHIAGIMVLSASTLEITSSNTVFSTALFGQSQPEGLSIKELIPDFEKLLQILTEEDHVQLVDGIVVPEHSFRRARALLALREKKPDVVEDFLHPTGLTALHRDRSEIRVDVQMRVVKSESFVPNVEEDVIEERSEDEEDDDGGTRSGVNLTEVVYALWITYSRHLHAGHQVAGTSRSQLSQVDSPPHQPSPGQTQRLSVSEDVVVEEVKTDDSNGILLSQQIREAASQPISTQPAEAVSSSDQASDRKKTIGDFVILEDMGQGAYGQVKLARYQGKISHKVVLKYVTKRRILVDTWTRDRRLGTVPLEIHVLDYLRRDGLRHPNIVCMSDFFEDDINYYIEMVPHGLPGMDLFDYIELRVNMDEAECRSIFKQVADAIHHLHTKAMVVHRDIKDENVVLDGEGRIKLIDFGSAAYIKNGPFDVFVGTIDYAAPEVLAGKSYRGKEQDVWALGILLYTITYKENPFYSIDEIMDHDLRVPYVMSEASIELIRCMLERDVEKRVGIDEVVNHRWCTGAG